MTIEVHQNKVLFTSELANHTAERVNLTRGADYKIFLSFALNQLKGFLGITLDVLAANRLYKFFDGCSNVVFCSLLVDVITTAYCMKSLFNKLLTYFKTYTPA